MGLPSSHIYEYMYTVNEYAVHMQEAQLQSTAQVHTGYAMKPAAQYTENYHNFIFILSLAFTPTLQSPSNCSCHGCTTQHIGWL